MTDMHLLLGLAGMGIVPILLCLYLFARLRAQKRAFERGTAARLAALDAEAAAVRETVRGLEGVCQELREWSEALGAPPPVRAGLNPSVRSQVLRRRRLGEDTAEIARSLGLPRSEVALLLKVNSLLLASLPPA